MTALSQKLAEGNLVVVDSLALESNKTRDVVAKLSALNTDDCMLVCDHNAADKQCPLHLATQNLPTVLLLPTFGVNVYDMLKREKIILTVEAAEALQERLLSPIHRNYWERADKPQAPAVEEEDEEYEEEEMALKEGGEEEEQKNNL